MYFHVDLSEVLGLHVIERSVQGGSDTRCSLRLTPHGRGCHASSARESDGKLTCVLTLPACSSQRSGPEQSSAPLRSCPKREPRLTGTLSLVGCGCRYPRGAVAGLGSSVVGLFVSGQGSGALERGAARAGPDASPLVSVGARAGQRFLRGAFSVGLEWGPGPRSSASLSPRPSSSVPGPEWTAVAGVWRRLGLSQHCSWTPATSFPFLRQRPPRLGARTCVGARRGGAGAFVRWRSRG